MKLSSIASYLAQSEAAILCLIAEKILHCAEQQLNNSEIGSEARHDAAEAQETAYALKCVAEQSILANDGGLFAWIEKIKASSVVTEGWIDTEAFTCPPPNP